MASREPVTTGLAEALSPVCSWQCASRFRRRRRGRHLRGNHACGLQIRAPQNELVVCGLDGLSRHRSVFWADLTRDQGSAANSAMGRRCVRLCCARPATRRSCSTRNPQSPREPHLTKTTCQSHSPITEALDLKAGRRRWDLFASICLFSLHDS